MYSYFAFSIVFFFSFEVPHTSHWLWDRLYPLNVVSLFKKKNLSHSQPGVIGSWASYSSLLCSVLVNKLPSDLQLLISCKVSEDDWKLNSLMEAIEAEVSARRRISANPSCPPTRRNKFKPPPSATSLVSGWQLVWTLHVVTVISSICPAIVMLSHKLKPGNKPFVVVEDASLV